MALDHGNNLRILMNLIDATTREIVVAAEQEVGTCGYKHHMDVAGLRAQLALATGVAISAAISHELLEAVKTIQLVVVHPKKEEGNEQPDA